MARELPILVRAGTQLPPYACRLERCPVLDDDELRVPAPKRPNRAGLETPSEGARERASPPRTLSCASCRSVAPDEGLEDPPPNAASPKACFRRRPAKGAGFRQAEALSIVTIRTRRGNPPDARTGPLFTPRPTPQSRLHCK